MFKISDKPLEERALRDSMAHAEAGGFVSFEGWVRDVNEGRQVNALEYEAFTELAEREGSRILREAEEKYDLLNSQCWHRVGHLQIGEMAVWVGVCSAHRADAFKACKYIIDEVKQRVPIWKKEYYKEGDSGWLCPVEGYAHARPEKKE